MKIITAPHPTLRLQAKAVQSFDKKFLTFLKDLAQTLIEKENPRGVGLAAPQVDKSLRVFVAVLGEKNQESDHPNIEFFINPVITKHSQDKILGPADGAERFEGCLSIPLLYGPVPRYTWIEVAYQSLTLADLRGKSPLPKNKVARFDDFDARVIQHEYDHLEGVLFTDHISQNKLPIYVVGDDGNFVEVKNRKEVLSYFL